VSTPLPFRVAFEALTGHLPFPWQEKLYAKLLTGELPVHCDVPTGLGKTSVTAVWVAALGASLSDPTSAGRVPRRLVYVVDRRVVVDQATSEVERLRDRLAKSKADDSLALLRPLVAALCNSATVPDPAGITVSTLRGKFADNHAWHLDPSRPAIIVGTVDMIGSRMLFAGYGGLGRNWRSLQAGLLVQDAWVVLDEAHLVPAFETLLGGIELQQARGQALSPFGVTRMSATLALKEGDPAADAQSGCEPLFTSADENDSRVSKRLNAQKALRFVVAGAAVAATKAGDRKAALAKKIATQAVELAGQDRAVVIFADTVDLVKAIAKELPDKWQNRVLALTGEMRGHERDELVKSEVLAAFDPQRSRTGNTAPAFLVATACVEVGMDFDADDAVCDVVALERMIQRLGRVNRRGETRAAIHAVVTFEPEALDPDKADEFTAAEACVWTLRQLPSNDESFDVSPAALRALDLASPTARRAFTPPPVSPALDEARLDDWSLTSLKTEIFPRPQVSYWLRGVMEDESVTTSLVWRADLALARDAQEAAEMVEAIPVATREIAQVATYRAAALMAALAEKDGNPLVVIRSAAGEVRVQPTGDFLEATKRPGALAFATVFLPSHLGGLLKGIPDDGKEALNTPADDVVIQTEWQRVVLTRRGGTVTAALLLSRGELQSLGTFPGETAAMNASVAHLREQNKGMLVRSERIIGNLTPPADDIGSHDEEGFGSSGSFDGGESNAPAPQRAIVYFEIAEDAGSGRDEDARSLGFEPVTLVDHTRVVEAVARTIASRLGLPGDFQEAVAIAARWHDQGKNRRWWQAAIGNVNGEALAKSGQPYFDHTQNKGYRHEFGSLIEARTHPDLTAHPLRELILHMIAAHHGHARPSFRAEAFDRDVPTPECELAAAEVPVRFASLQRHYGWWTLGWLEALVKCADAIASANPHWTAG
jgi:CRISPR-associated endonuclease/helicase Cas3